MCRHFLTNEYIHHSTLSLSLYLSSLSLSPSHLRMATWILVEINFSKVIGTSQDFPIVWSTDIVHVSAICTFWPDSWKVQIHDPYSSVIKWKHFFHALILAIAIYTAFYSFFEWIQNIHYALSIFKHDLYIFKKFHTCSVKC